MMNCFLFNLSNFAAQNKHRMFFLPAIFWFSWLLIGCGLLFEMVAKVVWFPSSHTWRTTWRTRTVWSVSGRPCAPTRQSPVPAVWDRVTRTLRGTAQTLWSYVSPFFSFFLFLAAVIMFPSSAGQSQNYTIKIYFQTNKLCPSIVF